MRGKWLALIIVLGVVAGVLFVAFILLTLMWWVRAGAASVRQTIPGPGGPQAASAGPAAQEPEYRTLTVEEAQRQGEFVIYLPTDAPDKAARASVDFMAEWRPPGGGGSPAQISVLYPDIAGEIVIWEGRYDPEFPPGDEGERVPLNGATGYYLKRDRELDFVLAQTEIQLSGANEVIMGPFRMRRGGSKKDSIRLAKSMKPLAPKVAREKGLLKD